MRFLVTGAEVFIGRNIAFELKRLGHEVTAVTGCGDLSAEGSFDAVFHTATLHRGADEAIIETNVGGTELLISALEKLGCPPVVYVSTEKEGDGSAYGSSKAEAHRLLVKYAEKNNTYLRVLKLAGEFGKWAMPNYNSVTATFCNNAAAGVPLTVNDPSAPLRLMYIDDIVNAAVACALGGFGGETEAEVSVEPVYEITVGRLAEITEGFSDVRTKLDLPDIEDEFIKKLYSTYLSYLPEECFAYPLTVHADHRGSFTELLHFGGKGQVSVNISKPHVTKGDHWHHTKIEKFIVVSGSGLFRFRRVGDDKVIEVPVSADDMRVVDIPVGYTHSIENTGESDLITIIWANEVFDPERPDTYYEKVLKEDQK